MNCTGTGRLCAFCARAIPSISSQSLYWRRVCVRVCVCSEWPTNWSRPAHGHTKPECVSLAQLYECVRARVICSGVCHLLGHLLRNTQIMLNQNPHTHTHWLGGRVASGVGGGGGRHFVARAARTFRYLLTHMKRAADRALCNAEHKCQHTQHNGDIDTAAKPAGSSLELTACTGVCVVCRARGIR